MAEDGGGTAEATGARSAEAAAGETVGDATGAAGGGASECNVPP